MKRKDKMIMSPVLTREGEKKMCEKLKVFFISIILKNSFSYMVNAIRMKNIRKNPYSKTLKYFRYSQI